MQSILLSLITFLALCFLNLLHAQSGYIYVSDAGNFSTGPWKIARFDMNGENGTLFIEDHLFWPQDILFLEQQGVVLISNLNSGTISKFNAETGEFISEFATDIGGPTRMKIGDDGLIYVLQWDGNGKVWRYNQAGQFIDAFTQTQVTNAIGLDWDAQGNLYVSSYNGDSVRKFSSTGEDMGLFINSNLEGPTNIWFEENGDLMVNDYDDATVKRFGPDGQFKGVHINGVPGCEGVDFLNNGNMLLGIGGASTVREYTPAGAFVKALFPPGALGLKRPNAVVIRRDASTAIPNANIEFIPYQFVTPTIGQQFQLQPSSTHEVYNHLDVYQANGQPVEKIAIGDSTTWNASHLPDGLYFIILKLNDGQVWGQRIIVQQE